MTTENKAYPPTTHGASITFTHDTSEKISRDIEELSRRLDTMEETITVLSDMIRALKGYPV